MICSHVRARCSTEQGRHTPCDAQRDLREGWQIGDTLGKGYEPVVYDTLYVVLVPDSQRLVTGMSGVVWVVDGLLWSGF
jgi:hypothetical protein